MNNKQNQWPWRVMGEKVIGATHSRSGNPCQDAILWKVLPEQRGIVLAVADGHGSSSSPYSDEGAALAVQVAVALLEKLTQESGDNLSLLKQMAEAQLPRMMVRGWAEEVLARHREKRIKDPDAESLPLLPGFSVVPAPEVAADFPEELTDAEQGRILLKYGSTLLAVLATARFFILFQLGDGDILVVESDGSVSRPLTRRTGLAANETLSLCTKSSWKDVQFLFQPLHGEEPPLLLVATDGYSNSFASEEGFFRVGSDYLALLKRDGPDEVALKLKEWLAETSESGSGDDIALGMVFRGDGCSATGLGGGD
ncbi:MAG TPA: PP2C family serine/threonine-protein phosphatase [Patescibacteria group bacterium]|nr:PP2C family serine/threonine-protein phosphatase [Patescibacteria group bacterium]